MKNVFYLLMGRFFATIATQMQGVAIGWQVYEITKQPFSLGLVGLAQFLPIVGLSLFSGQVADRFNRKKIVTACYVSMALCSLLFSYFTHFNLLSVSLIYSVLLIVGTTRSFNGVANQALLPHLVDSNGFGRAVAASSMSWQIGNIVGPAIGGLIYAWTQNATYVYGTSSALFIISVVMVALIRSEAHQVEREPLSWDSLLAGVRYVWNQKNILGATTLDLFAVLLGGAVALLPVYASDILKVGPGGYGLLRSAPGIGATCMGLYLASKPIQRYAGKKMFSCVLGFGIFTIIFGISKNFFLSVGCLVLMGALDLVTVVIRQSLVQLRTPPTMRGRVSAVNLVFISSSNELGEFESGITAQWVGTVPAVVIGGIGTVLVTMIWAKLFPSLRNLDRLQPEEKTAA